METKQVIRGAIRLLERDGWRQGSFGSLHPDDRTPRCISGALLAASLARDTFARGSYRDACQEVAQHLSMPRALVSFNDQPGRTKDEVLGVLRRAAG